MKANKKRFSFIVFFVMVVLLFCSCGTDTAFVDEEIDFIAQICGKEITADDLEDITAEALADGRGEKFPAVTKVSKMVDGNYAFISEPYGYKGIVRMAVVIDAQNNKCLGMRIIEHSEGIEYVRNWEEDWFTGRFSGKLVEEALEWIKLDAEKENQIVAVTGATVSTEACVLGVNAVFALYRE